MRRSSLVLVIALLGMTALGVAGVAWTATGRTATSLAQLRGVNFVSGCRFSHRAGDDPIVFPGQPGKSHDHTFIGNDTTNAYSTLDSLLGKSSSCRRAGDTAAYWVPTLVSASGTAITPLRASVYYRRHTLAPVQAFPPGFKLIAGDSHSTDPQSLKVTSWNCGPLGGVRPQSTIPTCPDAQQHGLALHVQFPDCWDGVNLDAADHQSHTAYSARGRCPADHPVALPAVQVNLRYPSAGGPGLELSSGGQYSGHADFFNAWNETVLQGLVNGCLNALRHCQRDS
jgi:Domain of unknown function (DUF1996)